MSVVSNSVRPHRQQPTRLCRPWDSPGKNTGVGCHFLLQCMKVKSESTVILLCPTLSNRMDCSLPGSSIHGIFQARLLEWVAIAFSQLRAWADLNSKHLIPHVPMLGLEITCHSTLCSDGSWSCPWCLTGHFSSVFHCSFRFNYSETKPIHFPPWNH